VSDWQFPKERYTVTEEHIKLLREAYVGWQNCEFGAPEIDPKRPYGNSFVYGDIAEILGIEGVIIDEEKDYTDEQRDRMQEIHRGTENALEIALAVGYFKAGIYERTKYHRDWKLVEQS
jgi:hypothetical protein